MIKYHLDTRMCQAFSVMMPIDKHISELLWKTNSERNACMKLATGLDFLV